MATKKKNLKKSAKAPKETATAQPQAQPQAQAPQPDPTALSIGDLKNLSTILTWHPQGVRSRQMRWQV